MASSTALTEVIFTTESTGQLWNVGVWDASNGTNLAAYKGSTTGQRSLALLGNDYILGAASNKPLIHVWSLQKKEQHQLRIVCPGKVNALAISPDGNYCVAAIAEKLHIWQIKSGNLLAVLSHHYQNINCVRFTDDGSYFLSGGDDNLVLVWKLVNVLSSEEKQSLDPHHTWSSHSLPITDIYCGYGGAHARVATSSLDQTCKLWDLSSGELLCSFLFESCITSVMMDPAEHHLFSGGVHGQIYQVNLYDKIDSQNSEKKEIFQGHSKQVNCLTTSFDGSTLVSGSNDCTVKIWDIDSLQCVRTLKHKGSVMNVIIAPAPIGLFRPGIKPQHTIQPFKRHLHNSEMEEQESVDICMYLQSADVPEKNNMDVDKLCRDEWKRQESKGDLQTSEIIVENLRKEVETLKDINRQLYEYTIKELLNNKV
ncbi:WD repeat-containing protein 18-like [Tubulanus polymorphus]|uniref:WD repeat-containing protein 18-like n=1 Tax=Tubulanus polymorphus TaxID=672921 RepID=UPI003DA4CA36